MSSVPYRIPKSLSSLAHTGFLHASESRDVKSEGSMLPISFLPTTRLESDHMEFENRAFRGVQAQAQSVDLSSTRAAIEIRSMQTMTDEIGWIVQYIQHKMNTARREDRSSIDIAILTRSQDNLRKVVDRLRYHDIEPRSRSFGPRVLPPEGSAPLNLLRLLANMNDDIAFESALDNDIILSTISEYDVAKYIIPAINEVVANGKQTNDDEKEKQNRGKKMDATTGGVSEKKKFSMLEAAKYCVLKEHAPFHKQSTYLRAMQRFLNRLDTWKNQLERYWKNRERRVFLVNDILRGKH